MNAKTLIASLKGVGTTMSRPAADAWRAYNRKLSELADAQAPLCKKREEHSALVDRVTAIRAQLADAIEALKSARADALNGDATEAAVKTAEHAVATFRSQLAELEPRAEVAALALSRITLKIDAISGSVMDVQRQAPRLRQDVLLEKMTERAAAFNGSLETFLEQYVELAAMARAHDELCNVSPGSTGVRSGHMFELAIPLPAHRSYSQTADHNLRAQIEARAALALCRRAL